MQASLQQLTKYLELEVSRGYDNGAVMGGLGRILERWEGAARAEGLPEGQLQGLVAEIRGYEQLDRGERQAAIRRLQTLIKDPKAAGRERKTADRKAKKAEPKADNAPKLAAEDVPKALASPVNVLDGVGAKSAERLARLGIYTLEDMLFHIPRRYEDYSQLLPIREVRYGERVSVAGSVSSKSSRRAGKRRMKIYEILVEDESGAVRASWFNQPWQTSKLKEGDQVLLSGQVDQYQGRLILSNPEIEKVDGERINTQRIVPFYPLTADIGQRWLRRLMHKVVGHWGPRIGDAIPASVLEGEGLPELSAALMNVHFPRSQDALKAAQQRLAFGELLLLQLNVLQKRAAKQSKSARRFMVDAGWRAQQFAALPFELTGAQMRSWEEIAADLDSGRPMNRLLQGDVGSGKTVVAGLGAGAVMASGAQAAIMAPTSILAEQHLASLKRLLVGEGLLTENEIALLLGATLKAKKKRIRAELAAGRIKLLIGTHALIEDEVRFADLQFIVIDEQHRFGVNQRAALRAKGEKPHVLVMTATPIPRSLALSIYGDLELSVIDELPPGRQQVETRVLQARERGRAHELVLAELEAGRQAFIIYPLVEGGEEKAEKAAVEQSQALQQSIFKDWRVALLHGRLKADEKERIMSEFRDGKADVLVSTSVIEVGVDVPNASVMLVEGAERFGLAQLHQFRGRVGRGSDKAYCILIPEAESDFENERLAAMVESNDGFVLAEYDLQQRGPGEFLGKRQSGYSSLRFASLSDSRMIKQARGLAAKLLEADPQLSQPQHRALAKSVRAFSQREAGEVS